MSYVTFNWKGEQVTTQLRSACRFGIDSVMADCVITAKTLVPVKYSRLQGSIMMRPAEDSGDRITGYWGSFAVEYAIYVEQGTGPYVIFPRNKKALFWEGASHPVKVVHHPGNRPRPYLVPAAEMHYPSLGLRVRAQIEWGSK